MRYAKYAIPLIFTLFVVVAVVNAFGYLATDTVSFIVKTADKVTTPTRYMTKNGVYFVDSPAVSNLSTVVGDGYYLLNYTELSDGSYALVIPNASATTVFEFEVDDYNVDSVQSDIVNTYANVTGIGDDVVALQSTADATYANVTGIGDDVVTLQGTADSIYNNVTGVGDNVTSHDAYVRGELFDVISGMYGKITR